MMTWPKRKVQLGNPEPEGVKVVEGLGEGRRPSDQTKGVKQKGKRNAEVKGKVSGKIWKSLIKIIHCYSRGSKP